MPVAKKKPGSIPVRLDPELRKRAEEAAARLRMPLAAVLRMAVETAVDYIEANDYRIPWPMQPQDWSREPVTEQEVEQAKQLARELEARADLSSESKNASAG